MRRLWLSAAIGLLVIGACSKENSVSSKERLCDAGESEPCYGFEGCRGDHVCRDDGQGWQTCICRDAVCAADERRCVQDRLEICSDDATEYDLVKECAEGTCDDTKETCPDPVTDGEGGEGGESPSTGSGGAPSGGAPLGGAEIDSGGATSGAAGGDAEATGGSFTTGGAKEGATGGDPGATGGLATSGGAEEGAAGGEVTESGGTATGGIVDATGGTSGEGGSVAASGGLEGGNGGAPGGAGGAAGAGPTPICGDLGRSCDSGLTCNGESCCTSLPVDGGTFDRGTDTSYPATVNSYCLDKYEVTVGRFRAFLADYERWISEEGGSHPQPDEGEHIPGYGSGWQADWGPGDELPESTSVFEDADHLKYADYSTWRSTPGTESQENLAINNVNWYEAFAFCIWDGGRLATDTEWEYAAAGGNQELSYPWGNDAPSTELAVYNCCGNDASCGECAYADLLPVGSKPLGNGLRWGHADLAGSEYEWTFDSFIPFTNPCADCAITSAGANRVLRSSAWGFGTGPTHLLATQRGGHDPMLRANSIGVRCARRP